jgi:multicomponent Na+:H+ antiporter subunit D
VSGAFLDFVRMNAPALVLLAPLVAMALAAFAPSGRAAWAAVLLGAAAQTGAAFVAAATYDQRLSNALGGWNAPLGVELRIDGLSAYGLVLIGVVAVLGIGGGLGALRDEIDRARQPLAAAATSAAFAAAIGLLVAGDLFVLFAALQLLWLSLGALTAMGIERDRRAGPAALNVVIIGAIGAGLFGFGAVFVFMSTGAVDLDQISGVLSAAEDTRSASAGLAMMAAGLAMAACMAPLHAWAIGAFSRGPVWSAIALGAILPAAGAIAGGRLVALAASALAPGLQHGLSLGLSLIGAAGALAASVQAMAARDLRRFAVYAGAAQAGCVAIGFSAASAGGVSGALFQLANQTVALFILYAAAAALRSEAGAGAPMSVLQGLGKRAPFLSLAISAALLSLIGAPMTAGFLSRWSLLQATFEARIWWGAAAIILSSLLAVVFAGRVFERMYLRAPAPDAPKPRVAYLAPGLLIATLLIVAFGFDGAPPLRAADLAAGTLNWGGGR